MSYSQSIFFIPVWFDDFRNYTNQLDNMPIWKAASYQKLWIKYLYNYASSLTKTARRNNAELDYPEKVSKKEKPIREKKEFETMSYREEDVFAHYIFRNPDTLHPYFYEDVLPFAGKVELKEVRLSCFATGVGFLEFWISYRDMTPEEIAEFSYHFKKAQGANRAYDRPLPEGQSLLYDVAHSILPKAFDSKLFFAAAHKVKYECNCFHYIHLDADIPTEEERRNTLYRLSRSYRSNMPISAESEYDVVYEASRGNYWGCSPEGMVNLVYDYEEATQGKWNRYLHVTMRENLENDYYFMYLLLLNQKYSAVQYIHLVALALERTFSDVEALNKRIVQLKNMFTYNIISDDSNYQNVYSRMYRILEIKKLLNDVIENENQVDYLQKAKHSRDDMMANKYLFGISLLSLFSAAIDFACYLDRTTVPEGVATWISTGCVLGIAAICAVMAIQSGRK